VLVHFLVPESPIKTRSRVDVPGAVLLSLGLVAMLVALSEGERWGWLSAPVLGLFLLSAASLVAWVRVELRVPEPMVDMRMMANRPVLYANLTALITGLAMFGTFAVVPQLVQLPNGLPPSLAALADYGFGASATVTGLYLVPGAVAGFFTGPLSGVLARRFGPHVPMAIGVGLAALGFGLLVPFHDTSLQLLLGLGIAGAGIPMSFAAMANVIVQSVRPSETGVATGMNTVMRTVGGVIGGQVVAAILAADTIGATSIPAESAFTTAFAIAAAGSAIAIVVALLGAPRRARMPVEAVAQPE
jgi:MFS family permease